MRELHDEPMVFREPGSETQRVLEAAAREAGVRLRKALLFHSREGMIAAVCSGLGVAPLAEEQFAHLEGLCRLDVSDVDLHTDVHVLCLRERRESRLIKAFMDVARELRDGTEAPPA
jgi:DNA-binding transcriptional LysR family regulator